MVPASVTRWLSSIGLTIRAEEAEFWALAKVPQNNALAKTQRESKRRGRIVVFLDPFFGEESPNGK
jgi:hypothetical protein